jgi:hypothetical protein
MHIKKTTNNWDKESMKKMGCLKVFENRKRA